MTFEQAAYFRLLLLCGYGEELEKYLDTALEEQEPLTDIVLELATCGPDEKRILSILNSYIWQVKESEIDYDEAVFPMVMSFLRRKDQDQRLSAKEMTDLMYKIARNSDRYMGEPWLTMYLLGDRYSDMEAGYLDRNVFWNEFHAFLYHNVCFCDYPAEKPKESLWKRMGRRMTEIWKRKSTR